MRRVRPGRADDVVQETDLTLTTRRLELLALPPVFLRATLAQDHRAAEAWLGSPVAPEWFLDKAFLTRRLARLDADPALQPWLLRVILLRPERRIIGHIGFHDRPGASYLRELSPGGVELGYEILPEFRRQGFAEEAARGLMCWAHTAEGVERFVVSISPDNRPSLNMAAKLGFQKIGSHLDEEDGPEDIFELRLDSTVSAL